MDLTINQKIFGIPYGSSELGVVRDVFMAQSADSTLRGQDELPPSDNPVNHRCGSGKIRVISISGSPGGSLHRKQL